MRSFIPRAFFAAFVVACSSKSTDAAPPFTKLPPVSAEVTTDVTTRVSSHARQDSTVGPNPSLVENIPTYETGGFGDTAPGAGEPYTTVVFDKSTPPAPGPNAARLVRFVHMPDLQLMDDESPTRLGNFDAADTTASALRPQDEYECRIINAAVRTINELNRQDPVSFVLLGGDNGDSAQTNEENWALSILGGAPEVKCDSGDPDDPIPGPDNDGKDPFYAEGLAMPFLWVTGNHDVLVQGNLPVGPSMSAAIGTEAGGGTRDYSNGQLGFVHSGNFVVADPQRALLTRPALMQLVSSHLDGHGIGAEQIASGKAIYTYDVPNTPLRFLVLDTAAETGGADGVIHQADVDASIKPKLDQSVTDGKYVILASHHAVDSIGNGGDAFGTVQADALLPADWTKFLGGYPNVIFSMVGHTHEHRVSAITTTDATHGFFEVMTSAIADFPHEFRVVEIYDQDNGYLMLKGTIADYSTENDVVAAEGLRRGVTDFTTGWAPIYGPGNIGDRNVELWIKKP